MLKPVASDEDLIGILADETTYPYAGFVFGEERQPPIF